MFLHASMSLKGSKGVLVMIHNKLFLLLVALVTVLLLISACSPTGGGSGGSNLTVLQLLQNSSKAMSQLKSTHIDLKANGSGQAINTNATSTPTAGTTTPTTTTTAVNNVTFNLIGRGDEALPNVEAMQFDVSQNGLRLPLRLRTLSRSSRAI